MTVIQPPEHIKCSDSVAQYILLLPGVLYFGDDDNTFDLRLFSEIRFTHRVSMFPVGLIGDYSVSSPVVRKVSKDFIFVHYAT